MNLNYQRQILNFNQVFRVEKKLGQGSFGIVLKVIYQGRPYALKIIKDFTVETAREIKNLAILGKYQLDVVRYYTYFFYLNYPCILMEYIDGVTVLLYFNQKRPFTEWVKFAKWLFTTIIRLHNLNIVHRDIKPDNIIKTKKGFKLVDFGLSCQPNINCRKNELWPKDFSPLNTTNFKAADNYQCAATLYYLLAHRVPNPFHYEALPYPVNYLIKGLLLQRLSAEQALSYLDQF